MGRLPLNTLSAFRSVAELQNLRAAAEVLHLTHSAVSQQIRGLEEQLGFDLFDRRGRRVVLNPAGEALLRGVQAALAQLDDGVQAAAAAANGAAQRLAWTGVRAPIRFADADYRRRFTCGGTPAPRRHA